MITGALPVILCAGRWGGVRALRCHKCSDELLVFICVKLDDKTLVDESRSGLGRL